MRHAVIVLLISFAGCKSVGGVASGLGQVASTAGHVAGTFAHVAAPAVRGFSRVATPVAVAAAKAAPTIANVALQTAEIAAMSSEADDSDPMDSTGGPPLDDTHDGMNQDLCLDCPDAGNCASCPADRATRY